MSIAERKIDHGSKELPAGLLDHYRSVRRATTKLTAPLSPEDCAIQSMTDASPVKWHLAHTSWFFETFVLAQAAADYQPFHPQFSYLFNSYYNAVGARHPRPFRGLLSRPALDEVYAYRSHVDAAMTKLLERPASLRAELLPVIELGLHHEQQHQELIVTDVKHLLSFNPLRPVYREAGEPSLTAAPPLKWLAFDEGLRRVGHQGKGFSFDNEQPRHRVFLDAFALASRLVTNGEYQNFMADGGYQRPELWLAEGWDAARQNDWRAPLYWEEADGEWHNFTLSGYRPVNPAEPVCHLSFYEADAYAHWAGARLPTEFEWEVAAAAEPMTGNFVERELFHPAPAQAADQSQLFGDVWEWTQSGYNPYPGFKVAAGALGEYNGKFMCSQMVLRGGSCATPASHIRATYRNFFYPAARWQFSGIRLAR